jgi:membrane-associated HD superfamily phosphohydrolase
MNKEKRMINLLQIALAAGAVAILIAHYVLNLNFNWSLGLALIIGASLSIIVRQVRYKKSAEPSIDERTKTKFFLTSLYIISVSLIVFIFGVGAYKMMGHNSIPIDAVMLYFFIVLLALSAGSIIVRK